MAASNAFAATVTYTLDLANDGTYGLFADADNMENFGLASYNVLLTGPILTVDHATPNAATGCNADFSHCGPVAFTGFRSADGNTAIGASQETLSAVAWLIQGMGQTPGDFASLGITPLGAPPVDPVAWDAHLLVARGTYELGGELPGFDQGSVEVFTNIFNAQGEPSVRPAGIEFVVNAVSTNEPPTVDDLLVHYMSMHPTTTVEETLNLTDDDPVGGTWALDSFNSPNSQSASVDANSGLFSWVGNGSPNGTYDAVISFTDAGGLSDTGTLSIEWWIPEPSSISLLGLALAGLVGIRRRSS